MPPFSRATTSYDITGSSDSVRYPWPIVVPKGPVAARSGSTWIHWWSPVASANASIRPCPTSIHEDGPYSSPSFSIAPPYDTRRPRVAGARREQEDELAVAQLAGAGRPVEREQRVDAAHVARVVEVGGAAAVDAELREQRAVHRRPHVDAAEVPDVREHPPAALDGSPRGGDEILQAHSVEHVLHRLRVGDVEEAVAAVRRDAAA